MPSTLIESRMNEAIPVLRWYSRDNILERGNEALIKDADDWIRAELQPALARINPQLMSCFGEDFGRSGDLTVIWPMQIGQDLRRRTPFVVELRGIPFKQQAQVLFHIVDHLPRFIGGAMDARGNGQYLAEEAALRYGARVEQVMLSLEWYRDNMPRYKAAFEDGKIELPQDDGILADHRMLRMDKGIARPDERRLRGQGGEQRHSDSAIAGALAYYASYSNHQEYDYQPVSTRQSAIGSADRDEPHNSSEFLRQRIRFRPGAW
jgi:phage FluMu gp28-like protein